MFKRFSHVMYLFFCKNSRGQKLKVPVIFFCEFIKNIFLREGKIFSSPLSSISFLKMIFSDFFSFLMLCTKILAYFLKAKSKQNYSDFAFKK